MLESLPFPKSRPGVLAAVALTIFFFILYYGIGFSLLLKIYDNQFQNVPFVEGSCDGLDTHVRIPKWVYSNGVQWVYVSIENHSGVEMKNITVQFFVPPGNSRDSLFLLPAFFEDNLFNDFISVESLQSGVTLSGRLLIPTREGFKLNDTKLKISCGSASGFKRPAPAIKIVSNQLGAFLHSTLENVLLPPWSNGIIPAFVILSCWLFEGLFDVAKNDKKESDAKNQASSSDIDKPDNTQSPASNSNTNIYRKDNTLTITQFVIQFFVIFIFGSVFNVVVWLVFSFGVISPTSFRIILVVFLLVSIPSVLFVLGWFLMRLKRWAKSVTIKNAESSENS